MLQPLICLLFAFLLSGNHQSLGPQTPENIGNTSLKGADGETAVEVDSFAISIGSARKLLTKSLPNFENAENQDALVNAAVNRMVDRHVVYDFLSSQNMAAGKNEIRLSLESFKSELAKVDQSIDQFLIKSEQRLDELEFDMAWRIAWNRYLERKLTDDLLKAYFNNHRREFDGSEMRVAHLLLKPAANGSVEGMNERSESIYADLKSGRLAWNEAVEQNSAAPTRDDAGEIGWIMYHKPMPAAFSLAAFKLEPGEVSSPVVTPFGVHLIRCMELREGKKGWRDALNEVRQSAIRDLFRQLARSHRPNVSIRYRNGFSEMPEESGQRPSG